jgi:hypothetical protein
MMMAVRSPLRPPSSANALISTFSPFSDKPDSPRPAFLPGPVTAMSVSNPPTPSHRPWLMLDRIHPSEKAAHLAPPSPNAPENSVDPSPVAPSSTGTDFTDIDEVQENQNPEPTKTPTASQIKSPVQTELKVHPFGVRRSTQKGRLLTSRRLKQQNTLAPLTHRAPTRMNPPSL